MKTKINKYFYYFILFLKNPIYVLSFFLVFILRIFSPFILIRIGRLNGQRIGHFAGETELYLLEQLEGINKPKKPFIDLFYITEIHGTNSKLLKLWKQKIIILPKFFLFPIDKINSFLPYGSSHDVGKNTNFDRDVNNLLDKYPSNVKLNHKDIKEGNRKLEKLGIFPKDKIVCLIVRDNRYLQKLNNNIDYSHHNYRDCDINNFILASEELTRRGYYVLRMGSNTNIPLITKNKKIVDYSLSDLRSDFMDIFLGYRCSWCITTSTGWDAVPSVLFRKPIVITNYAPVGYVPTYFSNMIFIVKKYFYEKEKRLLKHSELYKFKVNYSLRNHEFSKHKIKLLENTPEEIRDVCIQMDDMLKKKYQETDIDIQQQKKYWNIYKTEKLNGWKMHGEIKAKIGSKFLCDNPNELQ